MSRSKRQPFVTPTGATSQQADRTRASRLLRRKAKEQVAKADLETLLPLTAREVGFGRESWSGDGAPKFFPADQALRRK
jgi:hypothetical protein